MQSIQLPGIWVSIRAGTEPLEQDFDRAARVATDAAKRIGSQFSKATQVGKSMTKVGKSMTKYVTFPLVAGATAAGKFAMDYESAFAGVRKTVDATEEEYAALSKGIRDMAKEIPASADAIAQVAEAAGQLGIKKEHILDFTRVMIDLGESTNLSATEGATQLARYANIVQMSQGDFDRLGSVIVDLGNKSATTEADIVAMAMRLAGAGSQAKLTNPQIMGLAAGLSSIGLEADAGGTAFSKLLINMQVASEKGARANEVIGQTGYSLRDLQMMSSHSAKEFGALAESMGMTKEELGGFVDASATLEGFSKVTGMTAEQFQKAFEEDAMGALETFITGLQNAKDHGESAVGILDDMGISEVRLRDSILRTAGAGDLMTRSVKTANDAWNKNTALSKEANQRYKTTESQFKMLRNRIKDVAITLGEKLLPHAKKIVEKVAQWVEAFGKLDSGTQGLLIKLGGVAAIAGPITKGIGGILKVSAKVPGAMKTISGLLGITAKAAPKLASAAAGAAGGIANVGGAAAGASAGLGGLGASLGAAASAVAPFAIGAGVVVGAGVLIHKGLEQKATPAVDRLADGVVKTGSVLRDFGDGAAEVATMTTVKISDETKKQMGAYYELSDSAQKKTIEMYAGMVPLTAESTAAITKDVQAMAEMTKVAIDAQKTKNIEDFNELFSTSTTLTADEKAKVLADVEAMAQERKDKVEGMQQRICELYETIRTKGVENATAEREELDRLYDQMAEEQIRSVAQSANEQEILIKNLANTKGQVTTKMVEDTIVKLNQDRDAGVKAAEEKYDKMITAAATYKTNIELSGNQMTAEQKGIYDKMVADANTYKTDTIAAYEKIRRDGLIKLNDTFPTITKTIDLETGKQKSFFQKIGDWWDRLWGKADANTRKINALKFEDKRYSVVEDRVTVYREEYAPTRTRTGGSYHANGIDYVPYDGYMAHLHRGERVLTAQENKEIKTDGTGDININIAKVENNTKEDVRELVRRLGAEVRRNKLGRGYA